MHIFRGDGFIIVAVQERYLLGIRYEKKKK